ncbi:hypothetical protein EV424DRAFT_763300 [Suillus variegatus]|nr:hypothetical protein EV424DRAFT_763300 [Suillus variegatus]
MNSIIRLTLGFDNGRFKTHVRQLPVHPSYHPRPNSLLPRNVSGSALLPTCSMSEDNSPRKRRWGLLKQSRSNPHLAEEGGRRAVSHLSPPPPSRNGSRRGLSRFLPKSFDKFARSARQSPNPEPTTPSSSARDLLHPRTDQDLPPPTVTPEPNPDQSFNADVANISLTIASEQPDPKLVKETLDNAKAHLDGIKHISGMIENTASASDNLQSVPDTIDTFSQILAPLRVFNSVATRLADVQASISIFYVADLCA